MVCFDVDDIMEWMVRNFVEFLEIPLTVEYNLELTEKGPEGPFMIIYSGEPKPT